MNKSLARCLIALLLLAPLGAHASTIVVFNALLDGDQANNGAGTGSPGKGAATMTLDTETNEFQWFIAWENLMGIVTAGHFHGPAMPGQGAGVALGFDATTNPTSGSAILSAAQASDLLAGLWYINIHTTVVGGGEIRGQVFALTPIPVPAALWLFASAGGVFIALMRRRI